LSLQADPAGPGPTQETPAASNVLTISKNLITKISS